MMRVKETLQSGNDEPVSFYLGPATDSEFKVVQAVMSALATNYEDVPASVRPRIVSIEIEFH